MRQWRILGKASLSNDIHTRHIYNSLMAQLLKNLPAKLKSFCHSGDPDSTLGSGRSSGEGNGNPSSILAWDIPWTKEPGGLQSMGLKKSQTQPSNLTTIVKIKHAKYAHNIHFVKDEKSLNIITFVSI